MPILGVLNVLPAHLADTQLPVKARSRFPQQEELCISSHQCSGQAHRHVLVRSVLSFILLLQTGS